MHTYSFRNITRFDYKRTYGWWVRFQRMFPGETRKRVVSRFFSDGAYGSRMGALRAAQAWRDDQEPRLPPVRKRARHALRRGMGRLRLTTRLRADGTRYAVWAVWILLDGGRLAAASYALHVWGAPEAKNKAILWFKQMRRKLRLRPLAPLTL